jgi:1-acyl-sn-glycerol-3-phosphate acyltransferase
MRTVFSIAYWTWLALSSVLGFSVSLLLAVFTLPFDRNGRLLHLWTCLWGQSYVKINPYWKGTVEGREKIPDGPAVLVANHQSLGDILVLFGLFRQFKWVAKSSLFRIPAVGWNMWLNRYVGLRRGDRESVVAMFRACERWLDRGVPVMIFPEGTRSRDGAVQPFKDGAFTLAISRSCPVVPIAISGTGELLPKHGFVMSGRGTFHVRVLDPVHPRDFGDDAERLRDHVRNLIIAEKERLDQS